MSTQPRESSPLADTSNQILQLKSRISDLIKSIEESSGNFGPILRRRRQQNNNPNPSNASLLSLSFARIQNYLVNEGEFTNFEINILLKYFYRILKNRVESGNLTISTIDSLIIDILNSLLENEQTTLSNLLNFNLQPASEIQVSYNSIKGRRRTMEDKHISLPNFNFIFNLPLLDCQLHLYCIFDGHGGELAAMFSSLEFPFILAKEILKQISDSKDPESSKLTSPVGLNYENILKNSLTQLNDKFLKNSTSDSGSTAVVILHEILPDKHLIHSCWCGDSEAFILNSGSNLVSEKVPAKKKNSNTSINSHASLQSNGSNSEASANQKTVKKAANSDEKGQPIHFRLVKPHSLSDPGEKQRIEQAGGKIQPPINENDVARVNGRLAMARAIGDRDERRFGVDCLPDYIKFVYKNGADLRRFLILACDGLWDVLTPDDCYTIISDSILEVETRIKNEKNKENQASLPNMDRSSIVASMNKNKNSETTNSEQTNSGSFQSSINHKDSFAYRIGKLLTKNAYNKFSKDNVSVICVDLMTCQYQSFYTLSNEDLNSAATQEKKNNSHDKLNSKIGLLDADEISLKSSHSLNSKSSLENLSVNSITAKGDSPLKFPSKVSLRIFLRNFV